MAIHRALNETIARTYYYMRLPEHCLEYSHLAIAADAICKASDPRIILKHGVLIHDFADSEAGMRDTRLRQALTCYMAASVTLQENYYPHFRAALVYRQLNDKRNCAIELRAARARIAHGRIITDAIDLHLMDDLASWTR